MLKLPKNFGKLRTFQPSKADLKFAKELRQIINKIHRRFGIKMCRELDANCRNCQQRILVAYINSLINVLN